jgi:hypothetical protein
MTDLQNRPDTGGFEPEFQDVKFPFPEPTATIEEERLRRSRAWPADCECLVAFGSPRVSPVM